MVKQRILLVLGTICVSGLAMPITSLADNPKNVLFIVVVTIVMANAQQHAWILAR